MDRNIPDIWNIFSLSGLSYNRANIEATTKFHFNWSQKNQELLLKWCDRHSACDRPRTYDKFYQKTPSNFYGPSTDKLECSSEDEECDKNRANGRRKKKVKEATRTITEKEVKHLDRHLSMKKTIRKKIMRDLQQAFVEDPSQLEPNNPIDLQSLKFDARHENQPKFLDLLRDSEDSGVGSQQPSANEDENVAAGVRGGRTQKLRSVRQRSKSTPRGLTFSDSSSSCGGEDSDAPFEKPDEQVRILIQSDKSEYQKSSSPQQKMKKRSFWKLVTGGGKSKSKS